MRERAYDYAYAYLGTGITDDPRASNWGARSAGPPKHSVRERGEDTRQQQATRPAEDEPTREAVIPLGTCNNSPDCCACFSTPTPFIHILFAAYRCPCLELAAHLVLNLGLFEFLRDPASAQKIGTALGEEKAIGESQVSVEVPAVA